MRKTRKVLASLTRFWHLWCTKDVVVIPREGPSWDQVRLPSRGGLAVRTEGWLPLVRGGCGERCSAGVHVRRGTGTGGAGQGGPGLSKRVGLG